MIRKIIVGNEEMSFKCSAATSILYKRLFGRSLTEEMTRLVQLNRDATKLQAELATLNGEENREKLVDLLANDTSLVELSNMTNELIPQMAYIMWLEANKPQREVFQGLSGDAYIMWLSGLESDSLINASAEFFELWNASGTTHSKLKNA